ncbi:DUF3159 domain-containing protein [Quadrisphaera sp. DSM 44207]|uniref:DUF3159 domain-containing protein n=1 Tax=Quadrisphaera sp. DSM 44207 TaxID=1881057 RepID=UPI00087E261B|nr:DUF3159 domain-containing protein [Quadrisphaera sp. DSM 44207]SDQ50094.1 Protein of unknown function [Quadrisphaera sp. DSM 44207]
MATRPSFSLADAVGGPRGVLEAVLPGVAFIAVLTLAQDLRTALVVALAGSGVLLLARLLARLPVAPALSGAAGVGVCALAALRTGEAADYYAPGLVVNLVYAAVLALSTVRWPGIGTLPVVGLVVGALRGEGLAWRSDPARTSLYRRLTWLWVALFTARLAVQLPLYLAGLVGALAVARLGMGLPLFAAAAWLTWLALRRAEARQPVQQPVQQQPVQQQPVQQQPVQGSAQKPLRPPAPGAPAAPPRSPRR